MFCINIYIRTFDFRSFYRQSPLRKKATVFFVHFHNNTCWKYMLDLLDNDPTRKLKVIRWILTFPNQKRAILRYKCVSKNFAFDSITIICKAFKCLFYCFHSLHSTQRSWSASQWVAPHPMNGGSICYFNLSPIQRDNRMKSLLFISIFIIISVIDSQNTRYLLHTHTDTQKLKNWTV